MIMFWGAFFGAFLGCFSMGIFFYIAGGGMNDE